MKKSVLIIAAFAALLAVAGGIMIRRRLDTTQHRVQETIGTLQARLEAAERESNQLRRRLADASTTEPAEIPIRQESTTIGPSEATTAPPIEESSTASPPPESGTSTEQAATLPRDGRAAPRPAIRTNSMREIVLTLEECQLATRTLRCQFRVTNQSAAEKKFILGVGGTQVAFEEDRGGAMVFDDIGNDYVSVGGGVANHSVANCDDRWSPCEVVKVLTPGVPTAGWLRFDSLDPRATVIKLLRLRWSDGHTWTPMDYRNLPIERQGG